MSFCTSIYNCIILNVFFLCYFQIHSQLTQVVELHSLRKTKCEIARTLGPEDQKTRGTVLVILAAVQEAAKRIPSEPAST